MVPQMSTSQSLEPIIRYFTRQREIQVKDGIKVANQLTLTRILSSFIPVCPV